MPRPGAALQAEIHSARAQAVVAGDLARLLAINGSPRWLSKSALEVLVTAASSTLMELSGGQFELDLAERRSPPADDSPVIRDGLRRIGYYW